MHTSLPCVWNHQNAVSWGKEANSGRVTPFLVPLVSEATGQWRCESSPQGQPLKAGALGHSRSFRSHPVHSIISLGSLAEHIFCVWLWRHGRVANRSASYFHGVSLLWQRQSRLDIMNEWCPDKCLLYDGRLVAEHILILYFLDFSILDDSSVI